MKRVKTAPEAQPAKQRQPWVRPMLVVFGPVGKLTLKEANNPGDGFSFPGSETPMAS